MLWVYVIKVIISFIMYNITLSLYYMILWLWLWSLCDGYHILSHHLVPSKLKLRKEKRKEIEKFK